MKQAISVLVAAASLAAFTIYATQAHGVPNEEAHAKAPVLQSAANVLRYPVGSTQLAYLAIAPVKSSVPPVTEPLPARLVFDENHTVRVYGPVAGRVAQITAEVGARVKAGDVLAWLLAPDYDAAVADSRKALADHEAKQAAWQRAQRLHEAGVIATRDLEGAQADARMAMAELERVSARMKSLGPVGKDGRFALRAPISGVIAERHLNPGQEWRPDAADPAFVITDTDKLDVVADVAESDLHGMHVGQPVRIESDDPSLPAMRGTIKTLGVAMDSHSRRVPVRASVEQPPAGARAEMFVRMLALDEAQKPQPAVPNGAIVTTGLQSFVFIEKEPGTLAKVPVSLGHCGRDESHVSEGLEPGARVVTKGAILLDAELASDH